MSSGPVGHSALSETSPYLPVLKVSYVKKSNFIIFRPRQNRQTLDLAFNISNYSIDRVKEVTFLGVILDEHLTWKSHIHNVAWKVSKAVGIIYKSSFCLDNSSLRILYFSLIYPYLFYCVSVWASTYPSNLRRLITLKDVRANCLCATLLRR